MADLNLIKDIVEYGSPKAREAVQNLINSNFEFQEMLATATTEHTVGAMVDTLKAKWNLSDAQAQEITNDLKVALAVGLGTAAGALAYKRAIASDKKSSPNLLNRISCRKAGKTSGILSLVLGAGRLSQR